MVWSLKGEAPHVVRVPFTADDAMTEVEAALEFGVAEALEDPASLGAFIIEYSVLRGDEQLL